MQRKNIVIKISALIVMVTLIVLFKNGKEIASKEAINYLRENAQNEISLSDEDLINNKAFIISELHGFKENTNIKYDFLIYLHKERNINVYLAEIPFSSAYLINEYLNDGDENKLKLAFSFYEGTTFYTKEEYQFYQKLYNYNKNLENEKAISVYGIDIEHSPDSALYFYNYYTKENIKSVSDLLGIDFNDPILIHLKENIFLRDDVQERDKAMYQNYLFIQEYFQINDFFSQLGAKHGYCEVINNNHQSFSYLLNHDEKSPVKSKVLSLMMFYKNSFILETYNYKGKIIYQNNHINSTFTKDDLKIFDESFVLINLRQSNSPYDKNLIWYDLIENSSEHVTTDFYHYFILIQGSIACEPLDNKNYINNYEALMIYLREIMP